MQAKSTAVTASTITDAQIYAAKHHARRTEDDIAVQLLAIALERDTAHPAVQIALAYTVDYFNTKVAV